MLYQLRHRCEKATLISWHVAKPMRYLDMSMILGLSQVISCSKDYETLKNEINTIFRTDIRQVNSLISFLLVSSVLLISSSLIRFIEIYT